MNNMELIVKELNSSQNNFFSEHIDLFINKSMFTYQDCLNIMNKIRSELDENSFSDLKIMIRIQCGHSRRIQKWGEQFWKLVEYSIVPPEVIIYDNSFKKMGVIAEKIQNKNSDSVNNFIVFQSTDEGYIRYLEIIEREDPICLKNN